MVTFHPSLQDCENLPQDLSPPDTTQDLLDIIESTSSPVMAEISQNLDWSIDISESSLFNLDVLNLALHETTPPTGGTMEPATSDDQIIEMVLDLEDEYSILREAKNQ